MPYAADAAAWHHEATSNVDVSGCVVSWRPSNIGNGYEVLTVDDYPFQRHMLMTSGVQTWRCAARSLRCPVRANTRDKTLIRLTSKHHDHPVNVVNKRLFAASDFSLVPPHKRRTYVAMSNPSKSDNATASSSGHGMAFDDNYQNGQSSLLATNSSTSSQSFSRPSENRPYHDPLFKPNLIVKQIETVGLDDDDDPFAIPFDSEPAAAIEEEQGNVQNGAEWTSIFTQQLQDEIIRLNGEINEKDTDIAKATKNLTAKEEEIVHLRKMVAVQTTMIGNRDQELSQLKKRFSDSESLKVDLLQHQVDVKTKNVEIANLKLELDKIKLQMAQMACQSNKSG